MYFKGCTCRIYTTTKDSNPLQFEHSSKKCNCFGINCVMKTEKYI